MNDGAARRKMELTPGLRPLGGVGVDASLSLVSEVKPEITTVSINSLILGSFLATFSDRTHVYIKYHANAPAKTPRSGPMVIVGCPARLASSR